MAGNLETLRKILLTGLGAALMTEESLSRMLSELKLPRDLKNYLIAQASKRTSDLTNILSTELKNFLGRINLHEELHKALSGLKVHVTATIEIEKDKLSFKSSTMKLERKGKR